MTPGVHGCFRRLAANRPTPKVEQIIDGNRGFVSPGRTGMPMTCLDRAKIG